MKGSLSFETCFITSFKSKGSISVSCRNRSFIYRNYVAPFMFVRPPYPSMPHSCQMTSYKSVSSLPMNLTSPHRDRRWSLDRLDQRSSSIRSDTCVLRFLPGGATAYERWRTTMAERGNRKREPCRCQTMLKKAPCAHSF